MRKFQCASLQIKAENPLKIGFSQFLGYAVFYKNQTFVFLWGDKYTMDPAWLNYHSNFVCLSILFGQEKLFGKKYMGKTKKNVFGQKNLIQKRFRLENNL